MSAVLNHHEEGTRRGATWLVVPAYNEGSAIAPVLKSLVEQGYSVVVIDDGSRDDTSAQALAFPVTVLRHSCNLGQGAALQTGITYAVRQPGARFVVTFDSDGQHDVVEIERMLEPLRSGQFDVTLGSRFLAGGRTVNIGTGKRWLLRAATAYTRFTTRLAITDTHNGFRAFTVEAASRLNIVQNRMAHASEILSQITTLGLRYREVPVTIHYTDYSLSKGQSMLNSVNILWDTLRVRVR